MWSGLRRYSKAMFYTMSIVIGLLGLAVPGFAGCDLLHPQDCLPKNFPPPPPPPPPSWRPPLPHLPIFDPLHPPSPAQVVQIVADAINALQSQTLTGPLLAYAIQASHNTAYGQAIQIPQEMRWALVGYASQDSLDRVRFKVGDSGFANVARLIEQGGQASAVTLIDVIIFRGPTEASDPSLWAHELTHVDQYTQMGVQQFAAQYTQNYKVLEDPAYAKGNGWQAWYVPSHPQAPQQQAPPQQVGNFCDTQMGRFGPGPAQPLGSPCTVTTGGGFIKGQVGQ
jgi:Domain of unknown function (DUF4157)